MNGLYEPEKEKQRVQDIKDMRKAVRHEKARKRKEKREKYKKLYREELEKERAKLQAQKEKDIEVFKTRLAIEKAQARARARVRPFTPRRGFKIPSKRLTPEQKRKLKKAGISTKTLAIKGGKLMVDTGKYGWKTLEKMFGDAPTPRKRTTKRKSPKRKTTRKTPKRKGKTYYCRKCKKRHSYNSKMGRKHR